ncbi:MAG TPA: copper ion binding protein [Umezawaea sp.]|nr:copper ion binding protein [Umezawaea sp.]
MTVSTYTVQGMTCGHCVNAVTDEVGRIGGVQNVAVDLDSGLVTVTSEQPIAEDDIREAVVEAGYELVGS